MTLEAPSCLERRSCGSWQWELLAVVLITSAIYLPRLSEMPAVGEETRWAHAARQMLATGDWITPRQQGQVFPDRPPLHSWLMAAVGACRGEVDLLAIRLPSVLAVIATSVLIFFYARSFLSGCGPLAAALAFATAGQVLQIGRLGETEAVFTWFVSASLLVWHWGYQRLEPAGWTWPAGYSLAALGALTKGIQAPVYFLAVTIAYLLIRRDWRQMFSGRHVLGIGFFLVIVGAWQVPFLLANGWQATADIWTALARARLGFGGLFQHLASYPVEILVCLLPWSPLLVHLLYPDFRQAAGGRKHHLWFLAIALLVTFPSVWFAAGARGRYFMPLYPCIAVLVGVVVESSVAAAAGARSREGWRLFLRIMSLLSVLGGAVVLGGSCLEWKPLEPVRQPLAFALIYAVAGITAAVLLGRACQVVSQPRASVAVAALSLFLGITYTGVYFNAHLPRLNDLPTAVDAVHQQLPEPGSLVSFGPVYHRFVYYYNEPIVELPWPRSSDDVPPDAEFFCLDEVAGNTSQTRRVGREGSWTDVPNQLPFAWQPVAVVNCDRVLRGQPVRSVVVGRIRREEYVASPDLVTRQTTLRSELR